MPVLIQIRGAHKRYGEQVLLDGAEATLTDDAKVGFVGRNGCGKSTLLRVILGEEELDSGEVTYHPRLRLGYLRQHDPFLPGESALEFLIRDSGRSDWKCGEVAGQFELKGAFLEGPIAELSGGWQTRVKLAALLLHDPNLLLLDEPTNFLDLRTQILLEHFLRNFSKACLIVSHDRAFLRATCGETLSLSRGQLTRFPGRVDAFLEHQAGRREHDRRVNATVEAKRKQLQRFIDKNRAKPKTASQARSKSKQLERLELKEIETDESTARIRAPRVEPRQGPAVRTHDLSVGYPDHLVARQINLEVEHQQRTAIVGDNGQGKTTLLRTLVGSLAPLGGEVRWGYGCELGVYAQHVYTSLPPDQTVLEYLEYKAQPEATRQDILAQAGALLFRGWHVEKKISILSGGERARLCLAGLLLGPYNVLVLDEPANHLDVETVEALAESLLAYQGTVLFTAHDRHFMRRVATGVIEVRDGQAKNYLGDYDTYLHAVNEEVDAGERSREAARAAKSAADGRGRKPDPARQHRDARRIRKDISNVERKIARFDEQKRGLNEQLLTATDPDEALRLHQQVTSLESELSEAEEQWYQLQEELSDAADD
jgi:ATP-binding cassette subfamily F protein 3